MWSFDYEHHRFCLLLLNLCFIEEPRRIINAFLASLGMLAVVGFSHGGKWLYDETLSPIARDYATLVDMRVEKQTAPSRTYLAETDVVLFSTKSGCVNWKITGKLNLC